jgi:hypothetical protein
MLQLEFVEGGAGGDDNVAGGDGETFLLGSERQEQGE